MRLPLFIPHLLQVRFSSLALWFTQEEQTTQIFSFYQRRPGQRTLLHHININQELIFAPLVRLSLMPRICTIIEYSPDAGSFSS